MAAAETRGVCGMLAAPLEARRFAIITERHNE
jgi:hypothetical protein